MWYGMEITGLSGVTVDGNFEWPLVRIETDEGITGYGEVRDHGHNGHGETLYAGSGLDLAIKLESVLLGRDPTDVVGLFEDIRHYGGWGRLGGGVSGIEMALWDIKGKHLGVPVYELLGGAYRKEIRVYCDCRAGNPVVDSGTDYAYDGNDYTPEGYAEHAEQRQSEGYDFLKFDVEPYACESATDEVGVRSESLTRAGLNYMVDVVAAVRDAVDDDVDVGFDCIRTSHLPLADAISFGKAIEEYDLTCIEDLRPDDDVVGWRTLTERVDVPTITGEDLYTRRGFRNIIKAEALDIVGPDLLTAGGIRETVRIADFANAHGMPANLHFAASPIGFAASLQAAAAIENLMAVEFHAVGVPWWADLVKGGPLFDDGYAPVPTGPGLGIELDHDAIREHSVDGTGFD